ncbi:SPOR domain-containing protein [Alcanivorax sp. JB21]|uniref:SPOR domain-containing protein n=1 Tax=Alcanivorax limicola TaxID=2874102 RepID=UPI001CBACECC|nr:SPOR domain-containing protein [Alcanivorax limicola]MBZ2187678.1 SPOR domain-containing protein [Alcanivorax limicola]
MNRQVTQRIVGVILLLLLAAIVTPFLLRSPEEVRVALDLSLPPAPESPAMAIEPVVSDAEVAESDARISDERDTVRRTAEAAESPVGIPEQEPAEPAPDVADEAPPTAPPAAQLSGWAVQVGSFSRVDGAESLAQRLRDAGYRAFTRRFEQPGQTLHRVYLGPELDRDRARDLRERVAADENFALQGLVVSVGP